MKRELPDDPTATAPPAPRLPPRTAVLKLALLVAVVVAVLLGVLLTAGNRYWREVLRGQIDARLSAVAASRSDFVREWVGRQQDRVEVFATRGVLRNFLEKHVGHVTEEPQRKQSQENLDGHVHAGAALSARIASRDGPVLLSSDPAEVGRDLSGDPVFRAGLSGPVVGWPRRANGRLVVDVAAPSRWIDGTRGTIGVVLLTLDAASLAEALHDITGLGETGEAILGVRDGSSIRYLFPPRNREEIFTAPQADLPPMAAATEGRELFARTRDHRGVPALAAGHPVGYGGWGLVAKMDESEAYAPITRALRYGLGLTAIIALAGLAAAFGLARYGLAGHARGDAPQASRALGILTQVCALAVVLIGLTVLAGWALKIDALRSGFPGLAATKVNSALSFILAGAALALRRRRGIRVGCATAVIVFSGLSLLQDITGADFGTDRMLFGNISGPTDAAHPGRMSPATDVSFILLGTSLLLLATRTTASRRVMESFAVIAGSTALLALVDYLYGTGVLYQFPGIGSFALPTVSALVLLATGILCARTDGVAGVFASASLGGQVARRFLPLAFVAPIVLGWLALMGYEANLFGATQRTAVFASSMVFALAVLIWRNAVSLEASDAERTEAEKAVRESEERMRLFLANAPAGIAVFDREMRYLAASERWLADYGLKGDIIGRLHYDLFPELPENWKTVHQRALAGEILRSDGDYFKRADGSVQWVKWETLPWRTTAGGIGGIMIATEDITARKEADEKLRQLTVELEQRVRERTAQLQDANHELESFSYSISHDLRAPLRAVNGFARILLDRHGPQMDDEGRRLAAIISAEGKRMGTLIDALLSFSRLGRQALARGNVDMNALAREGFSEAAADAGDRSIDFRPGELPQACGDRTLLRQVFVNLFSNAVKFTRNRAAAVVEAGGRIEGEEAVFWVRDNGAGFDPRYADKLFGVFQRLHTQNEFEGTGVGLAFVQRIVLRHGGRIWAESKPDEGATFYFSLPRPTGGN